MVKDSCHKNFNWVWSRKQAKQFKEDCNASSKCINLSKPGYIYSREECRGIVNTFYQYLIKQVTTYRNLSLLTYSKKEYYEVVHKHWVKFLLIKHNADVKNKLTKDIEKKLKKVAKDLRELYINNMDKLDLTRISNFKLSQIAKSNKLDYEALIEDKENLKKQRNKRRLENERINNFEETGLKETNEQRRFRESLISVKKA